MTHNILLQIEAVRKHLEKLEEERQGISDLINKLEEARDTLAARLLAVEMKQEEAEKCSHEQKAIIERLDADGATAKKELTDLISQAQSGAQNVILPGVSDLLSQNENGDETQLQDSRAELGQIVEKLHQDFDEKSLIIERRNSDLAQSIENKVQAKIAEMEAMVASYKQASIEPAQSLAEKVNNAIAELHKAFNLRAHEMDDRLEKFSSSHFENLEQINKIYEQIYVAYEKLQSSVDAMEVSLESKSQVMQRQSGEVAEILQAEQENNEARIAAIIDSLRRMSEDDSAKFQQQMQGKMDELELHYAEFQDLLQARDQTLHARMQQMWLGIMLGAIISLAAFILSRL
ncbi:MAG: hypothetical protein ACREOO_20045 [bacterium]